MLTFNEFVAQAPKIVVDMGAVPYVCKGANVMAPGIRRVEGEFAKGNLVVIVDEKHGKALALGESMFDAATLREAKKGPVIKTLHYVSDKIWDFSKTLAE
jgi:PUA domain protein